MLDKKEIEAISSLKILVIGDVMLDEYIKGDVERISPEAPVPILNAKRKSYNLGGAGNVAMNLSKLNVEVTLIGSIGDDNDGEKITLLCAENNIQFEKIIAKNTTTKKLRIVSKNQQMMRVDFEEKERLPENEKLKLKKSIEKLIHNYDGVIVADYAKGFIDYDVMSFIKESSNKHHLKIFVDPKQKTWDIYKGVFMITPNMKELTEKLGIEVENNHKMICNYKTKICEFADQILVTRSEKGMSLLNQKTDFEIPIKSVEVFDVSGAGDTVIAVVSACILSNIELERSIKIANEAAQAVIKKMGTTPITLDDLKYE